MENLVNIVINLKINNNNLLKIESKDNKEESEIIKLKNGQIITMNENFQEKYRHGVLKLSENKIKNPRISITFRQFIE
jgi:hypothetical protein